MVNDPIQLGFQNEAFAPVPGGTRQYVPAVQNKPGELDALRHASPETWSRLTPLVEIVGRKNPPATYKREAVGRWVKRIVEAIGSRPCFLDILRLRPEHLVTGSGGESPVLSSIYAAARKRGMVFVPVLPIGSGESHADLVRDAIAHDGRGAALRYPILSFALEPSATQASVLANALTKLGLDVTNADIFIDLAYLSGDEELHPDDVGEAIEEVTAVGQWRSVVLLGTSMRSMLGGMITEGTIGEIPRREWELWSALRASPPARLPTYGDYVVQHPHPPSDDNGGGPGMRANIRYTTSDLTLVVRGQGPLIQEGREQYRNLCQQLCQRPEFAGPGFSWGDAQIAGCASGEIEPGSQNQWRGAGSSHHLRLVTEQVSP
jgi:hypothetical protein